MPETQIRQPNHQAGFLLLEVMIAILIFSIGILSVIGLQATMKKNSTDARFRSVASLVAEQRLAEMWGDPTNAVAYLETNTDISDRLPSGTRTVTQPNLNQFMVTVEWQQPGQDERHRFVTLAYIVGG